MIHQRFNSTGYLGGFPPPGNRFFLKPGATNPDPRIFNPMAHSNPIYTMETSNHCGLPPPMNVPPPTICTKGNNPVSSGTSTPLEKSQKIIKVTKSNLVMAQTPVATAAPTLNLNEIISSEVPHSFPEMSLNFMNDNAAVNENNSELQTILKRAKIWENSPSASTPLPPSSVGGVSSFLPGDNSLTPLFSKNGTSFQDGLSYPQQKNAALSSGEIGQASLNTGSTNDQNLHSNLMETESKNSPQEHGSFLLMTDNPLVEELQEQIKELCSSGNENEPKKSSSSWTNSKMKNDNDSQARLFGQMWPTNVSDSVSKASSNNSHSTSVSEDEVHALELLLKSKEQREAEERSKVNEPSFDRKHQQQAKISSSTPWPEKNSDPSQEVSPAQPAMSWSKMASMKCPPPEKIRAVTLRPTCYLDVSFRGDVFRVLVRVRPDKAKKMSENFIRLCMGRGGRSYKGCKFFICKPDDHIVTGDMDNQVLTNQSSNLFLVLFLIYKIYLRTEAAGTHLIQTRGPF